MTANEPHYEKVKWIEEADEPLRELVLIIAQVAVREYLEELGRVEPDGQQEKERK